MRLASPVLSVVLLTAMTVPAEAQDNKPLPRRFAPEVIELLSALSHAYELNGKEVLPKLNTEVILRAVRSKDAKMKELGRGAARVLYLLKMYTNQKPNPAIEKAAKAGVKGLDLSTLEKLIKKRTTSDRVRNIVNGIKALEAVANKDDRGLEEAVFTKPQQDANRRSVIRLFGHIETLKLRDNIEALAGKPVTSKKPSQPIRLKLETGRDKSVMMAFTNQTDKPLHNCLAISRAIPDPKLVDKKTKAEIMLRLAAPKLLGASKENIDAATVGILLQHAILNLDRGSVIFVPEIPAGATVRMELTSAKDMDYVKRSELMLWSDELTTTLGGDAEELPKPLRIAATPLKMNKRGVAAVKSSIARGDPIETHKLLRGQRSKAFSLKMSRGRTYVIQALAIRGAANQLIRAPRLRVEDTSGKTLLQDNPFQSPQGRSYLIFMPRVTGEYRIVCSNFTNTTDFNLYVQRR